VGEHHRYGCSSYVLCGRCLVGPYAATRCLEAEERKKLIEGVVAANKVAAASTPKPTRPVSLGACMMASLVGHTATDSDVTLGVGVVNVGAYVQFFGPEPVASLLPGPGWLYVATAALVDAGYLGVAYSDCKH
jgi:hypothetical protein